MPSWATLKTWSNAKVSHWNETKEEQDWRRRLGSPWAAMVASILTKGGQFLCSHYGIAFPDFALAGNTPRAEGQENCPSWNCCSCVTLGVSSRALFPSVDVWWQLGDCSLQSSGTRVQEAPSLWLSWGQRTDLHQVGVGWFLVAARPPSCWACLNKSEFFVVLFPRDGEQLVAEHLFSGKDELLFAVNKTCSLLSCWY